MSELMTPNGLVVGLIPPEKAAAPSVPAQEVKKPATPAVPAREPKKQGK